MKDKVMKPWLPMTYKEERGKVAVQMWGRKYTSGSRSFLESIMSQDKEILANPIRIVGTENGKEIKWGEFTNLIMNNSDENAVSIVSSAQSDAFVLNVSMNTEYDGCIDLGLTIVPQGTRPGKIMGIDVGQKTEYSLERLWLEIPLKHEIAKLYHVFPNGNFIVNGETVKAHGFKQAGELAENMQMAFKEQIFIGNDDVGICVFAESDKDRQVKDEEKAVECIKKDDEYLLRIRLLDSEPIKWKDKSIANGMHSVPLSYRMGIIATPLKPFPQNPYKEKAVHIDCFKKIPTDMQYDEFLLSPFEDTDEIVLDRIKRLGVGTLYLHEKWNDLQNSPFLTKRTAERAKTIIKEAHKRNIKVIPYFGYEISTLSPYWSKLGDGVMKKEAETNSTLQWFRYPSQRAPRVCFNTEWQDIFVENIEKIFDELDFDGIYLDSAVFPWSCANESHGCGYRDENGKLHNTYTIWAVRNLMKRLYKICEKHGGILNNHTCGSFNIASMSFCHSLWEGETIQQPLMIGEINKLPDGYYRSVINGQKFGLPVNMLCYSNPPEWTFSKALSQALLFGCLPKPNDVGEPLDEMASVWNLFDKFSFDGNQTWHYYFENNKFSSSDDKIKISYYKNGSKYLLICCNAVNKEVNADIIFKESNFKIISAVNASEDKFNGQILNEKFEGFGYKLLLAETF